MPGTIKASTTEASATQDDIKDLVPEVVRTFITLGFDFAPQRITGLEAYGDCPLCGKRNKFYINVETGQWSCKSGKCGQEGNTYTFINLWWEMYRADINSPSEQAAWNELADERGLPVGVLKEAGIVYDGERWAIPVRNAAGSLVNLRLWRTGRQVRGLPTLDNALFGAETLGEEDRRGERVFLCEGEFDAIALRWLLDRSGEDGVVVSLPGVGTFKDTWIDLFLGRECILCFDNDGAGAKGLKRVFGRLRNRVPSIWVVAWPAGLPEGFDVRDFVTRQGTYEELLETLERYMSDEQRDEEKAKTATPRMPITDPDRPRFEEVLAKFKEHMYMTGDMEDALRIIYAVVLSNQVDGDPLWVHIVSPPGTGKTALLMSLRDCPSCFFASTLTPNSLVSGFGARDGSNDPSLLPKLDGKTFVLKDFTEVLNMQKDQKQQVYGVLRGAFDEEVEKTFGNGITRKYRSHFNMLSGVTHSVFAERTATMGERFLMFHLVKGVGFEANEAIRAAIMNVGKETRIREELSDMTQRFVEVDITPEDEPDVPLWMVERLMALAQVVSMLRAVVERDIYRDKLLSRPQHEMGTRLGKQFKKLLLGLAYVNNPISIGEHEYRMVVRVALDTCVGFNLDVLAALIKESGLTAQDLSDRCKIPVNTLRDQLEDLDHLGVLYKLKIANPAGRGAPMVQYHVTDRMREHWVNARLEGTESAVVNKVRRVRVKRKAVDL